jgi:transcriptional regulator with XRE-family HTH domain
MGISELRQKLEAARNSFDYRLEKVLFDVAERVCNLIKCQNINRSELAQRLDVTPAYITKLLNGNPNLTIKSLLKLSDVLGQTLDIRFTSKLEIAQSAGTFLTPEPSKALVQGYVQSRAQTHLGSEKPSEAIDDLALAA